uniref:Retrotransposon gag domain-containing protein n=1 Tax=Romanomermis culicivorax TaxID=13658 RepID=A0A915IX45_ROMCU
MRQEEGESALEFLKRFSNHVDLVYSDQTDQVTRKEALKELTTVMTASAEKQKQAKQQRPYCIYDKNNTHATDECKTLAYGHQQQQRGGFNRGMPNQYYGAQPASTQATQPAVSKAALASQVLQRDPGIDSGIPDIYTADQVRKFRESGHTDNQIKKLGRRKLAQKANRAKKREGEDVVEISDDEGEKTGSMASGDSKFIGSTTLLTDSTKSKTKTTSTSNMPGTMSSTSQVQSMVATGKVPNLYWMGQCGKPQTIEEGHLQ